jgi:hypothetical protein
MEKKKFNIEYQLKAASLNVLWNSISTPLGLTEWFADGVTVDQNRFTFNWNENYQTAILISSKPTVFVRFQWEEDSDTEYYFELGIVSVELTGDLILIITDFAEPDEKDDLILLWNKEIEELRRKTGI